MTSQNPDARSLGEILAAVSEQSARLVRAEIDLAKAELTEKAKKVGIGVGMFAAAAFLGIYGLGALIATMILLIALLLPAWAAALIVTFLIFATAAVLVLVGAKKMSKNSSPAPQAAIDGLKHDIAAVKSGVVKKEVAL